MTSDIIKETENNGEDTVTPEELKQSFPPSKEDSNFKYTGKCRYCQVEVSFSDTAQIRIIKNKEKPQTIFLYHVGCYDRYIRRTID